MIILTYIRNLFLVLFVKTTIVYYALNATIPHRFDLAPFQYGEVLLWCGAIMVLLHNINHVITSDNSRSIAFTMHKTLEMEKKFYPIILGLLMEIRANVADEVVDIAGDDCSDAEIKISPDIPPAHEDSTN